MDWKHIGGRGASAGVRLHEGPDSRLYISAEMLSTGSQATAAGAGGG